MTQWTQEQSVAFEAARECVTDMMGICSAAIAAEEAKPIPDAQRLAELEAELTRLTRERACLSIHDDVRIAGIRAAYGARIRAHRQRPQQQAA